MKKKAILILTLVVFNLSNLLSQKIDELSFALGRHNFISKWQPDNVSASGLYASSFDIKGVKNLNSFLDLEIYLGYIHRKTEFAVTTGSRFYELGTATFYETNIQTLNGDRLSLNHLTLGSNLRLYPSKNKKKFYLHGGLRAEYLIAYKDITVVLNDSDEIEGSFTTTYLVFEPVVNQFNRLTLWATGGVGYQIANKVFVELEGSTQLTAQSKDKNLKITNKSFGVSLGIFLYKSSK